MGHIGSQHNPCQTIVGSPWAGARVGDKILFVSVNGALRENPPTQFLWADIFENSNDGFLTPQWPQYSKRSRTTPLFYTLLSIYALFWVSNRKYGLRNTYSWSSNLICSFGGRKLWFILQWNKSFLIASLRSISSFQYFAWPARCLCDRKWAKKEKYSEFRHFPRDSGTGH